MLYFMLYTNEACILNILCKEVGSGDLSLMCNVRYKMMWFWHVACVGAITHIPPYTVHDSTVKML